MVNMCDLESLFPELETNYCYLHQHPELGFEELETSAYILKKLEEYGVHGETVARTGIIATIDGKKPGKTVAIRADMDGLPIEEQNDLFYKSVNSGKMHACGHDSHVTMLLGAAHYLANHRDTFEGRVRLIFQPAEEGAAWEKFQAVCNEGGDIRGGAASMIAFGALKGVDACFALHVNPLYPTGTIGIPLERVSASSDIFELTIKGKGGHGSAPEAAVDPLGALAAVISAYHALPSREVAALDACALSIGAVKAGEAWNVIPDSAFMTGGLRTFSNEMRDYIFRRMEEIGDGICSAHRCTAHFVRHEGYAPTINSRIIAEKMVQVAEHVFGVENTTLMEEPMMGSEDVGYYFQKVPGAIGWLGAMPENGPVAPHNPSFQINLKALQYGVLFHISMVMNYLNEEGGIQ